MVTGRSRQREREKGGSNGGLSVTKSTASGSRCVWTMFGEVTAALGRSAKGFSCRNLSVLDETAAWWCKHTVMRRRLRFLLRFYCISILMLRNPESTISSFYHEPPYVHKSILKHARSRAHILMFV